MGGPFCNPSIMSVTATLVKSIEHFICLTLISILLLLLAGYPASLGRKGGREEGGEGGRGGRDDCYTYSNRYVQ